MKIFHYTETASAAGMKQLPALIICGVLIGWFGYQWLNGKSKPLDKTDYIIVAAFVGFLVFAASSVLKRTQSNGTWDISINDKVLQWNAPDGFEKSFLLNLDQIAEIRHTIYLTSNDESYELITTKGKEISLNKDSGIDLDEFAQALSSQGITLNTIKDEDQ